MRFATGHVPTIFFSKMVRLGEYLDQNFFKIFFNLIATDLLWGTYLIFFLENMLQLMRFSVYF